MRIAPRKLSHHLRFPLIIKSVDDFRLQHFFSSFNTGFWFQLTFTLGIYRNKLDFLIFSSGRR